MICSTYAKYTLLIFKVVFAISGVILFHSDTHETALPCAAHCSASGRKKYYLRFVHAFSFS